jgi:MFS family permease
MTPRPEQSLVETKEGEQSTSTSSSSILEDGDASLLQQDASINEQERPPYASREVEYGRSSARRIRRFSSSRRKRLPTNVTLPILVMLDMFAVALVVPLLFQYYKAAGINSASQREWLSSLFSSSQIVGGVAMGILTDAKVLCRQTLLYFSFAGSALSYALIVYGGLPALVLSRILVGLVKQTMTVTTTMLTHSTLHSERARAMGRLTAASTFAWIVGPTVGALLFKYVHPMAPPILACTLFGVNLVVAAVLLPGPAEWHRMEADLHAEGDDDDDDTLEANHHSTKEDKDTSTKRQHQSTLTSIQKNLQAAFSSRALGAVVASRLVFTFVTRATSYSQLGSFYEDMYGLEPHHRGYISSYQQLLGFVVQAVLVGPILAWTGGERQTAALLSILLAGTIALESLRSLGLFLLVLSPISSLCMSMINLSLINLSLQVAPAHGIFSILTALDILQSVVSVSVPFYRTLLFSFLKPDEGATSMTGDPDPVSWVLVSAFHWALAAAAMSVLLVSSSSSHMWKQTQRKRKGK